MANSAMSSWVETVWIGKLIYSASTIRLCVYLITSYPLATTSYSQHFISINIRKQMLITVQQNPSWQLSLAQLSPSLFYSFYWILFFFISFSLNYFYFILYILIIFHIIWFLTLHLGPLDDIVTLYLELPDYLTVYLGPPDDIWPYTWGHKMTFDLIHGAARWYLTLYLFPPFSPPVTTFSNRRSARIKKLI